MESEELWPFEDPDLRTFLTPNDWKVALLFVFYLASYLSVVLSLDPASLDILNPEIAEDARYCVVNMGFLHQEPTTLNPHIFTYLFAPFTALVYGHICGALPYALNLPYVYVLACAAFHGGQHAKRRLLVGPEPDPDRPGRPEPPARYDRPGRPERDGR